MVFSINGCRRLVPSESSLAWVSHVSQGSLLKVNPEEVEGVRNLARLPKLLICELKLRLMGIIALQEVAVEGVHGRFK
jgi:hypothetical protein